jgi:hypothetical protein
MAFAEYQSLGEALGDLHITQTWEEFVQPIPLTVSDHLRNRIKTRLTTWPVACSEAAVGENLIYPVLEEAALVRADVLVLWSHVSLYQGGKLLGTPDYVITKRSPYSKDILEKPYALIMEAKRNDFDWGWGQCLAAMHAVQVLNGAPQRIIYGGVSDGFHWEFGKLEGTVFAHHPRSFELHDLDELLAALNHVLELCKQQVLIPAEAA